MNTYFVVLLILFGGAILSFAANKISNIISGIVAFIATASATAYFYLNVNTDVFVQFNLAGFDFQWGLNSLSILFTYVVLGLGSLATLYSIQYMKDKKNLGYFYFNFLLGIGSMMGILFSQDFISFFIFWEIMTWSSYLIVVYNGDKTHKVGIKYMIFSAIGAYAMLMSIVMIYADVKSFLIADFINYISQVGLEGNILQVILLIIGFGVKSAMMPLHVWAPRAYSESPMSYTSLFSGALSKMGVYGLSIVLLSVLINFSDNSSSDVFSIGGLIRIVIQWLGAITAVMGTLYALRQDDAKKLLAYSSVAQLGYIITGLAVGTELAVMGALFLAVLHAIFKGALFMAMGAVERQAGTTDMTKISGLIRKMPFTFIVTLMSIIALAGVPPLGGFVGKWLLYEGMITSGHYFLVILIFFSSTAAFLYSYRILFGIFLGQEEKETVNVREAPITMLIPMLLLAVLLMVFGTYPGLLFEPIANAMSFIGFNDVVWEMSTISNVWGDKVSLDFVSLSIFTVFIVAMIFLTIKNYKRTHYASTKDISTSGEMPTENENLTFQINFFQPFERAVAPLYKRSMDKIYNVIGESLEALFNFVRTIYTGNGQTYALYVVIFLVIMLIFKDSFFN